MSSIANTEVHLLPHKFIPRDYQKGLFEALFVENKKRAFIVWHRRCGKDKCCFNIIVTAALMRVGNYHIVFPQLKQGKKVIWKGIDKSGLKFLDHIPPELIKHKNNVDLMIELYNGSTIQIMSDDIDSAVGMSSCGIVLSEYAIQNPQTAEYLEYMVDETGGFMIYNTTPRGHNHAYRLRNAVMDDPNWYFSELTVTETRDHDGQPLVTDEAIKRKLVNNAPETIRQELFCDWDVALATSYFSADIQRLRNNNRICDFSIDTSVPVHTFWDLGYGKSERSDPTAICFVQLFPNGDVKFIHYYERNRSKVLEHVNYLKDFRDRTGITYGNHYLPHDGDNGESDGTSFADKLYAHFKDIYFIKRVDKKRNAINSTKDNFSKYWIHKTECQFLIDCLMEYHEKILKTGMPAGPEHNWASHAADAFMGVGLSLDRGDLRHHMGSGLDSVYINPACQESLI